MATITTKSSVEDTIGFCKETITKKHLLETGWIELASRLKEIRDSELYKGGWENFEDFLNDPEMDMDPSQASRIISIHERLVLEHNISPAQIAESAGWAKISEVLPVITDKESAIEWLDKCKVLTKSDLRKEVKVARGGKKEEECAHLNTYTIVVCRDCGLKIEDHE